MSLDLPAGTWADEMRRVLDAHEAAVSGWVPPMDVIERPSQLEIRLDVPGVPLGAVRVTVRAGTLVISGDKPAVGCCHGAAFHVAERACGRFHRAVPLRFAFDASRIQASLANGELRILVPRIDDRRGRDIEIPVVAS